MDYIAFAPFLTDIRKDYLRDIKDYATYICVSEEEALTAINLFGRDKAYIIMYFEEPDFDSIRNLDLDNFIIQVPEGYYSNELTAFPFMFFEAAKTWEEANRYAHKGVAAVRFEAPLTFSTEDLRQWKTTFADTLLFATADPTAYFLSSWFVRPEDTCRYKGIFDALCVNPFNLQYYTHSSFRGPLKSLLPSLQPAESVINQLLPSDFAVRRLNCKQVCESPSYNCTYCDRIRGITKQMERMKPNGC